MAKRGHGETLAVDVYHQLRSDIINCRLLPGGRLKPTELRARFGVSIGVIREALSLLAAQGLVDIEHNHGFHVTTLSIKQLEDLVLVRKLNEGAALRLSIERGDVTWESEVLAIHHQMASLPSHLPSEPRVRNEEWAVAHVEFHLKLLSACDNPILVDLCRKLSDSAELYRAWSAPQVTGTRRDVAGEHRALMEAALARDATLAVRLLKEHIGRTAAIVIAANESQHSGSRTADDVEGI